MGGCYGVVWCCVQFDWMSGNSSMDNGCFGKQFLKLQFLRAGDCSR